MRFIENKKVIEIVEKVHLYIFRSEMSDVMRNFLKDLSFVFFLMIIASSLVLVLNVVGARVLGADEFGIYQIVFVVAQFLMVFMIFGINTASTKYISNSNTTAEKKEIAFVSLLLIIAISLFVVCFVVGARFYIAEFLKIDVSMVVQSIFLASIFALFYFVRSVLQGWKRVRVVSILDLVNIIGSIVVFCALLFIGGREISYVEYYYAIAIGCIVFSLSGIFFNRDIFGFISIRIKTLKKILRYGAFAILGSVSGIFLSSTDKLLINYFHGSADVGVYSVYVMASVVVFMQIVNIFNTVFFPYASESRQKKDIVEKLKKISKPSFFGSFFGSIISIIVIVYILGESYEMNYLYAILFAFSSAIMVVYQMMMWFLNACGVEGVRTTVKGTLIAGFLNFTLGYLLISMYGIVGAIASTIFSNIFLYFYFVKQINKDSLYEGE